MLTFAASDIKKSVPLVRYFEDVGIPLRDGKRRAVATWRGGENASVSIDEAKGLWKDHVAGDGGTVIDACMRIEGRTFAEAVRALGERYGINPAKPGSIRPRPTSQKPSAPKPPDDPDFVRRMIGDMDFARNGSPNWVREMSPCLDWLGHQSKAQTADPLTALYNPDDILHISRKCRKSNGDEAYLMGKPGENIKTRDEWLDDIRAGRKLPGDVIFPNPFSGAPNSSGSYITAESLADFPFVSLEFDHLPLGLQFAFWRGFLQTSPLAPRLASITYSGNKSLHALLFVGCATLADWKRETDELRRYFYSDPEPAYRVDKAGLDGPRQGTRLPGVRRRCDDLSGRESDVVQALLYLNPFAVREDAEERWRDVSQWSGPLE